MSNLHYFEITIIVGFVFLFCFYVVSKKLYTVRVFKKDRHPCIPGDKLVFGISQLQPAYLQVQTTLHSNS